MKRDLATNIIGGLVVAAVCGIVTWMLELEFKDKPDEPKEPVSLVASSPTSNKSATKSTSDESTPSGTTASVKPPSRAKGASYVNTVALSGTQPITPVAVKGSADASREVLAAFGIPLRQGVFTRSFFTDGVFERALNGEGSEIAQLKLSKEIGKVVLLEVGDEQKSSIPDAQGAIKVKRRVAITIIDAHSGAVIKAAKFIAEGVGFDEEFVEQSFNEDLTAKLEPVRRAL